MLLRARRASYYAIVGVIATIAGALPIAISAPGAAWASGGGTAAVPAKALHGTPHAPITARTPALHYAGPVYELSLEGQLVPYVAPTAQQVLDGATGGSAVSTAVAIKPRLVVPGRLARLIDGLAAAPMEAPEAVKEMIWSANEIIGLPVHLRRRARLLPRVRLRLLRHGLLRAPRRGSALGPGGLLGTRRLRRSWRRRMGDGVRQPRTRVHGRGGAAPGHERGGRPVQPAGTRAGARCARATSATGSGTRSASRRALATGRPASGAAACISCATRGGVQLRLRFRPQADRRIPPDGRVDRTYLNRREGQGQQAPRPGRRPGGDAGLHVPAAGRTASERQEGDRRRGDGEEAPSAAGDLAPAAAREARHAGAPGDVGGQGRPRADGGGTQERGADGAPVAGHADQGTRRPAAEADRLRAEAAREDRIVPHQEGGHQGAVLGGGSPGADLRSGHRRGRADGGRGAGDAASGRQDGKHEGARRRGSGARSGGRLRRRHRDRLRRRRHRSPAQAAHRPVHRGRRNGEAEGRALERSPGERRRARRRQGGGAAAGEGAAGAGGPTEQAKESS